MLNSRSFVLVVVVVGLAAVEIVLHLWKDSIRLRSTFFGDKDPSSTSSSGTASKDFVRRSELDQLNASFHKLTMMMLQQQQQQETHHHQQQQHQPPLLPQCDEVMQAPNSPFQDGAFLTSFKTPIQWTPRADGSRQIDLDSTICRLKRYTAPEARTCLASQYIAFVGDSLTRYQFLSLAYFLEHDTFPPRFGNSLLLHQPCTHINESGHETCSPVGQPNICMEMDWRNSIPPEFGAEEWMYFFTSLGGGQDGGIMNGRMECNSARSSKMPGTTNWVDNELYTNGQSHTILSHTSEFGGGGTPHPLRGFSFSNCSQSGTCRHSYEQNMRLVDRAVAMDFDWYQSFPKAIDKGGVLRRELPRSPDVAIYNRGHWRQLSGSQAQSIMPVMYDWVNSKNTTGGRCFFKSTTAGDKSIEADYWNKELHEVRPHVHAAGCEYLDYAYLTDTFSALASSKDWQLSGERGAVYWDAKHFMPWVYEELNQVLLNVLCNSRTL